MPSKFNIFTKSNLARWMIPPASSWRRKSKSHLKSSRLFWPFVCLLAGFIAIAITTLFLAGKMLLLPLIILHFMILMMCISATTIIIKRIEKNLFEPLAHLRNWALRMRGGNLSARIPVPQEGEFANLATDINNLSEALRSLTREMDGQVRKQTERLEKKSHSLQLLHHVAANINESNNLHDLLARILLNLRDIVNARGAAIRLLTADRQLKLVVSIGLTKQTIAQESLLPLNDSANSQAVINGKIFIENIQSKQILTDLSAQDDSEMTMIAVPLQYRGQCIGLYNLYATHPHLLKEEDIQDLLINIGQHLSVAIEKTRLENETQRLALMEERNFLAHELHDSLAQTLASLRFKIRFIEDELARNSEKFLAGEISQLKGGIDQAHQELRELLAHFRTRMDERGLLPALTDMINRFEIEAGVHCFFQCDIGEIRFPPLHEVQIFHIVQEALSNIRKHARAQYVRVLFQADVEEKFRILIEDDGQGIAINHKKSLPGEHVGLSIMQERACHLHGELSIDSEPGEGTRVELIFPPPPPSL